MESYGAYLKSLTEDGFISEKGSPLKCTACESKNFVEHDEYFDERGRIEYQVSCSDCGQELCIWAYGSWQLL